MVAGTWIAGGEVGAAAVGFDPLVFVPAAASGRPVGRLQAERTMIEINKME
jgi:hypothetical protein